MKSLKYLIFLPFFAIGLIGKVSAEAVNQVCYPGDNNTDLENLRKPRLDFKADFWPSVTTPISNKLFGRPKMPELGTTNCHPFTEDLTNLLMDEYDFSLMRIVSDVQTIDGNPWWCTDFGTSNHPQPFDEKLTSPHYICYPKKWAEGIGKFMYDLEHQDQIILRNEKELLWRCIPLEFWCRNINSYHNYMDIIALLLSFGVLLKVLSLIAKGIELLTNHVIGQILPKPAPAA